MASLKSNPLKSLLTNFLLVDEDICTNVDKKLFLKKLVNTDIDLLYNSIENDNLSFEQINQLSQYVENISTTSRENILNNKEKKIKLLFEPFIISNGNDEEINNNNKLSYSSIKIISLIEKYLDLKNKISILYLIKILNKLKKISNAEDVPNLIVKIYDNLPKTIPHNSKIKNKLLQTVSYSRSILLLEFNKCFENHLQSQQNNISNINSNSSKDSTLWFEFLRTARSWLLSYLLISIFPTILSESKSLVIDKYKESLDIALTPMWGRFSFHLAASRDENSINQLFWSFKYSYSFIKMLLDLTSQFTFDSSSNINHIFPKNYKEETNIYIFEKATRFVRSHLIKSIINFQSDIINKKDLCVTIIENVLKLDAELNNLNNNSNTVFISTVITDVKFIKKQWLNIDRDYFCKLLLNSCKVKDNCFSFSFGVDITASPIEIKNNFRCYHGIYECLSLLIISLKRYQYVSIFAQDSFSEMILEPILCISLGLFLLRIRSNNNLNLLCNGVISRDYLDMNNDDYPIELRDFMYSVHYFQKCLNSIDSKSSQFKSNSNRFENLWNELYSWLPNYYINNNNNEFSPSLLIEKVFNIVEKSSFINSSLSSLISSKDDSEYFKLDIIIKLVSSHSSTFLSVMKNKWNNKKN
jgi:hypothetical protein